MWFQLLESVKLVIHQVVRHWRFLWYFISDSDIKSCEKNASIDRLKPSQNLIWQVDLPALSRCHGGVPNQSYNLIYFYFRTWHYIIGPIVRHFLPNLSVFKLEMQYTHFKMFKEHSLLQGKKKLQLLLLNIHKLHLGMKESLPNFFFRVYQIDTVKHLLYAVCSYKCIYCLWVFESDLVSLNSRPLVSNGKSNTHIPESKIIISNSRMDAVWWHPFTKPTVTRGHTIPPILPIALAIPTPVVRTEVGYWTPCTCTVSAAQLSCQKHQAAFPENMGSD